MLLINTPMLLINTPMLLINTPMQGSWSINYYTSIKSAPRKIIQPNN